MLDIKFNLLHVFFADGTDKFLGIYNLKLNIDSDETGQKANKQTSLKSTNFQRTRSGEHMFFFFDHVTRTKGGTVGSAILKCCIVRYSF